MSRGLVPPLPALWPGRPWPGRAGDRQTGGEFAQHRREGSRLSPRGGALDGKQGCRWAPARTVGGVRSTYVRTCARAEWALEEKRETMDAQMADLGAGNGLRPRGRADDKVFITHRTPEVFAV